MAKKSDTLKVKVLELLALAGELSSDEIKSFVNSSSYGEKIITALKKETLIRKYKIEDRDLFRLAPRGKKYLKEILPGEFESYLTRQRSMNRIRDDKRRIERRDKLAKMLFMFHRADIKILPDEKTLLKNSFVNTRTDSTDTTDTTDTTDAHRPEFYTSMEIKNLVPDYKTSIGSRALGILIANNMLYIVYYTADGELLWKHDSEENFLKSTSRVLARKLFGKNYGTYQLVFGDNEKTVAAIMKRYGTKSKGKIYPSADMPDMIFALTNTEKDATLDIALHCPGFINDLKAKYGGDIVYDEKMPFFDGVKKTKYRAENGIIQEREEFYLFALLFDMVKVAQAVDVAVKRKYEVRIYCFDYQQKYLEAFIGKDAGCNITIETVVLERGGEDEGK